MVKSNKQSPSNFKYQKISEAQQVDESVQDWDTDSKETMVKTAPLKAPCALFWGHLHVGNVSIDRVYSGVGVLSEADSVEATTFWKRSLVWPYAHVRLNTIHPRRT